MTTLLSDADRQEALSVVYLSALAASAGFVTGKHDFDRDGTDLQVRAGGGNFPTIDFQLKATFNLPGDNNNWKFPLKKRNYDLLIADTQCPRYLVVLKMPRDSANWVTITDSELVLKECLFWVSLKGLSPSDNTTSVTIEIPKANLLNETALKKMIDAARSGGTI